MGEWQRRHLVQQVVVDVEGPALLRFQKVPHAFLVGFVDGEAALER